MYARIIQKVAYGREVEKIECTNHMVRNTQYPLELRKLLTSKTHGNSRLERTVKGIRTAIKNASSAKIPVDILRHNIANAAYHVFGRHTDCK